MKKYYSLIVLCFVIESLSSQSSYYVSIAPNISWFKYLDSERRTDPNMTVTNHFAYALGAKQQIMKNFYIREEIGNKNFGANSSVNNQKINWRLNYFDLNFGIGFVTNEKKIVVKGFNHTFYGGISYYFSRLMNGQQTVGASFYDLLDENAIKKTDHGINGQLGVDFSYNKNAEFFFELRYTHGLNQLESNSKALQNQQLYNRALSFNIGLGYTIGNYGKWKN